MGCCFSADPVTPDNQNGKKMTPEHPGPVKDRSCTDTPFLFLMVACLAILLGLTFYCVKHGDVARQFNGYDNCGNVCGVKNERETDNRFSCKGVDMTNKKFLLVDTPGALYSPKVGTRECVENCQAKQGYTQFLNRCIPKQFEQKLDSFFNSTGVSEYFQEAIEDINLTKGVLLKLALFALVFSLILVFLLRYIAGIVVWLVLIGVTIVSIGGTIFLWTSFIQKSNIKERNEIIEREKNTYFMYAIAATFITLLILVLILVMRKRIKLVVRLFKEAGKAIQDMPLLLVQPLVTFLALGAVFSLCVYFGVLIQGGGFLALDPNQHTYYKKDTAMKFARVYDLFILFWLIQFCIGCQHMVIAGSVATWFFTRNKERLDSPISTSICNLFSYHLGSVALGSFVIAVIQFIRLILMTIKNTMKDSKYDSIKSCYDCLQCCFACLEKCVQYLTRNAYIEVAMFGESFCRGGQQAFKLLTSNALRVAAINSVGDFVLFLGKVLVVASTILLGFTLIDPIPGVQHLGVPLTIIGLISYFIAHCFFTVYEMVIDTIFLCFCEDCEMNDGANKPYFMSSGLMEFVDDSNRQLRVGDGLNE